MRPTKPLIILAILAALALLVKTASGFYVNLIWFQDLSYGRLFLTPILAKIAIGVVAFILYALIIVSMGLIGFKTFIDAEIETSSFRFKFPFHVVRPGEQPQERPVFPFNQRHIRHLIILAGLGLSLLLALSAVSGGWLKLLEFINATPFGYQDSVFGKDISFYVFKIPFYSFVLSSLISTLMLVFVVSLVFFPLAGLTRILGSVFKKGTVRIPTSIRHFWAGLLGVLFLLLALNRILNLYSIVYSQAGYVYGAGYTDIHVTIPMAWIMAGLALICAGFCFAFYRIDDHRLILRPILVYILLGAVGGGVHSLVQYTVSNNEFLLEKQYIQEELKFTKIAYNLDKLQVKDYPGTAQLTLANIQQNRPTIDNIRLNDPVPLQTVLSQNQGLRYYYRFNDIDVDRYRVDGRLRQVLLAPREISEPALTEKAGTFVNLTMRYTHGYGITASLANQIDDSGYAKLIVKDIPPQSSVTGFSIQEPRIYFGELTNDQQYGYVIGNTAAKEFDYPQGESNAENTYQGSTGLSMGPLNKLFLSAYFDTLRLYIAGEVNSDSKLLMRRNIRDRIVTLMPYLKYDQDPYIVAADDGKLYWMLDGYTYTDKFPYSAPVGDQNYLRNSVKVVVDAYNGTVGFYIFDPQDPIIQTLSKVFPGVFQDKDQMPANLIEHIRYPEDYFNVQAQALLNFHVTDPSVFYNREDTWDIAKKLGEDGTVPISPYYTVMSLPGEKESEFTLMLPFTPASRQDQTRNNMVAWLAARNDGDHYGELILYRMPKNVEIQGPLMIDSLINQDPVISSKMNLWSQGGSQVIRGNLLVVPIDDGFIYVEPIYIKAERQGASIPQMQAIVFAINQKLVMVETKNLDTAIAAFFGQTSIAPEEPVAPTEPSVPAEPGQPTVVTPKEDILKKLEELKKQLLELEEAVKTL